VSEGEGMSRVKRSAYVVNDLEESASFFEDVRALVPDPIEPVLVFKHAIAYLART
jgi:hypothetical protein